MCFICSIFLSYVLFLLYSAAISNALFRVLTIDLKLISFLIITVLFKLKSNLEKAPLLFHYFESYSHEVQESNLWLFLVSFDLMIKFLNFPFLFQKNVKPQVFKWLECNSLSIYEFNLLFMQLFFQES